MNFSKENFSESKIYDLIIIGAGPAGIASAIYASRATLNILIIESDKIGGKLNKTGLIENYPGFQSVMGAELATVMESQLVQHRFEIREEFIIDLVKIDNVFKVSSFNGNLYFSKAVIVATGSREKKLNVPKEDALNNKGVSYCAICDGALFKGKDVLVVGGGYSGCESSYYLSSIAKKVYLIHHGDQLKVDLQLNRGIQNSKNIEILFNTEVIEIIGKERVESVILRKKKTNLTLEVKVEGVFPCIGLVPNSNIVKHFGVCDANGCINVDQNFMTEISGLFSAGDVLKKWNRQIVTAVSDGATAAQAAIYYIQKNFF